MKYCLIRNICSFYRAGKLLHLITLSALVLTVLSAVQLSQCIGQSVTGTILYSYLTLFLGSNMIFAELDARSRLQNYKQIRDQLYFHGFQERIIKPMLKSRCQRDAAMAASRDMGIGTQCQDLIHSKGYRWYHIFPDYTFSKPQFFFSAYFWRTTFFAPRYVPRTGCTENPTIVNQRSAA